MNRIFAIFISLGLLYGGIAWAVEDCLKRANHRADHDHHSSSEIQSGAPSDNHHHENEVPASRIHCADLMALLGPVARVSAGSNSGFFSKANQLASHNALFMSQTGCGFHDAPAKSANHTRSRFLLAGVPYYLSISVLII